MKAKAFKEYTYEERSFYIAVQQLINDEIWPVNLSESMKYFFLKILSTLSTPTIRQHRHGISMLFLSNNKNLRNGILS